MEQTILNLFRHPVVFYYTALSLGTMVASIITGLTAEIANIYLKEGFPK